MGWDGNTDTLRSLIIPGADPTTTHELLTQLAEVIDDLRGERTTHFHRYVQIGTPFFKRKTDDTFERTIEWQTVYCEECTDHKLIPVKDLTPDTGMRKR